MAVNNKKKILLIRPKNTFNYYNYPPLNLVCIGSVLESHGFKVKILDAGVLNDFNTDLEREMRDALFIAIGMITPEIPHGIDIMKLIRTKSNIPIVVGGWHCTLFPEQMAESELTDYVVIGEGEDPVVDLAIRLSNGSRPSNKIRPRVYHDLNALPMPNYDLVPDIEHYITNYLTDRLAAYVPQPIRWLPYDSSRGCPSQCAFCINVVAKNQKYRKKSANKVLDETDRLIKKYKLTHLKFIDDNYFVDIKRARTIATGFIKRGQHKTVTYDCECRCDYFNDRMLNDETLELLRESGLVQLTLGIESGSMRTLKIMRKGITVEQAERAVQMCDRHGIIARSSFMFEVPGERRDDIVASIQFINKMRKYPLFACGVGSFRPYPRCDLTKKLIEKGYLSEPQSLEDWLHGENIEMYTSAELKRPWQVDPEFSENAAHYLNLESETRIGLHQLSNDGDREKLQLLIEIAKIRNRNLDYKEGNDTKLYKDFLRDYYQQKRSSDTHGEYPLSRKISEQFEGDTDG
ncbi:MAG: B12-binding domain-containing radical SAM protein [Desulfobacteraceae bacterium]|nr:B12-binding domain-containing radical SAM protein [Actinomycetota bacterium]MCG2756943.1 B12-binding domain-containing radical SAM protein [Desulfobacteraceae bacterium]